MIVQNKFPPPPLPSNWTQELCVEDVNAYRDGAPAVPATELVYVSEMTKAAVAGLICAESIAAVRHNCGLTNATDDTIIGICSNMPAWALVEQRRKYINREETAVVVAGITYPSPVLVEGRRKLGRSFSVYLRGRGVSDDATRVPHGMAKHFLLDRPGLVKSIRPRDASMKHAARCIVRCLMCFLAGTGRVSNTRGGTLRRKNTVPHTKDSLRKRARGAGVKSHAPIMRQQLYEWWSTMRHSVDWVAMTRFPRSVLRAKGRIIYEEYCAECLVAGVQPDKLQVMGPHWFNHWEDEYHISLRKPNRLFKVPKHILEERLAIGWENTFRLRKLILEHFGYDPDMENFDQSPYHANESGILHFTFQFPFRTPHPPLSPLPSRLDSRQPKSADLGHRRRQEGAIDRRSCGHAVALVGEFVHMVKCGPAHD